MNTHCKACGKEIKVLAFIGTDYCSVDCRKRAGDDQTSIGTLVFLTKTEENLIKEYRNG